MSLLKAPRTAGVGPIQPRPAPAATKSSAAPWRADAAVLLIMATAVGLAALIARQGWLTAGDAVSYRIAVAGGLMMLAVFLYPLRKHIRALDRLGATRWWLWGHITLGLLGPWLILVHSTFHIGSLNAGVALYRQLAVLVVGGGDSAIEAAVSVAEEAGTVVTLAYRGEAFARVKPRNRERLQTLQSAGRIEVLLKTDVVAIEAGTVRFRSATGALQRPADAVIVCAGGELPTPLLQSIGVAFETKYGTA